MIPDPVTWQDLAWAGLLLGSFGLAVTLTGAAIADRLAWTRAARRLRNISWLPLVVVIVCGVLTYGTFFLNVGGS